MFKTLSFCFKAFWRKQKKSIKLFFRRKHFKLSCFCGLRAFLISSADVVPVAVAVVVVVAVAVAVAVAVVAVVVVVVVVVVADVF